MDNNSKKIKMMATWSIAVFATVFAVFMALFWLIEYPLVGGSTWKVLLAALSVGWPIFLIAAVLCCGLYYGYKYYLSHKK
jgi:sterol desaturase/sphingolipid hydroxylase (fatty acid hydroxylase superfamily)